jgi:hypothetical protein
MTAKDAAAFAKRVEKWRYGALWFSEGTGRQAAALAAWLLANTKTSRRDWQQFIPATDLRPNMRWSRRFRK